METIPPTSPISTGEKLQYISKNIDSIRDHIQGSIHNSQPFIRETFSTISELIIQVAKEVTEYEGERQDLFALTNIGQVVNSSLQVEYVLRIVMDTIIRLTGAERGFLMLRGEDGNLRMRIARNWEQESIKTSEFEISRTVADRVINEGIPIVTINAQEDPRFDGQDSVISYNLRSILCVPLIVKEKYTGVIYADNRIRTGIFTESDRDLLAAFANQAAVAIDNAQLFESVQHTLAEVTELKNMMDNIFASIASGVITADFEDKITLCNNAAEKILGYSKRAMVGKNLNDCFPPIANQLKIPIEEVRHQDKLILGLELNPTFQERGQLDLVFNLSPLKDASKTTQGVAIVIDDLTEKKRLQAHRRLFERMVPPAVIDQIDLKRIQLGGERAKITTLFADIRGYTKFSEALAPEKLISILNLYLGAAAEVVLNQSGTLDKFMGDALMAIFNAPVPQPDHSIRAVRAAVGIRDAIANVRKELAPEFHLGFGIGIHFGDAVLGLVGTEKRLDYTAIGDSVNTAKRIQENASKGTILISNAAYENIKESVLVKKSNPIQAKGKKDPIKVFEIQDLINK
jgi:PAS domain S-box-containing protein